MITCTTANCSGSQGSLFHETNIAPGFSTSKTVSIDNSGNTDTCNLYLQTTRSTVPGTPDLSSMINMVIKRDSTILFGNTSMSELFSQNLFLGSISAGSTAEYTWEAAFDPSSSNDYQSSEVYFDFNLSFTCGSTPADNSTNQNLGGNTIQVLGEGTEASQDSGNNVESIYDRELHIEDGNGGNILGTECEYTYPWWIFLLIQTALSLFLIFAMISKRSGSRIWLVLILFGVLSQAIHLIAGCGCLVEYWCTKYIYLNLTIVAVSLFLYYLLTRYIRPTQQYIAPQRP